VSAIHETAYPRLKEGVTLAELAEVYTPTAEELALAMRTSTRSGATLGFPVLFKTFQRLGYFVLVGDVPTPIVRHIAHCLGTDHRPERLLRYDESGTPRRHIPIIRAFLNVQPFNSMARALVAAFVAHLKAHLARIAAEADASFPANEHLRIEAGEPVLGRLSRLEEPQDVKELERRIAERIEPLDMLRVVLSIRAGRISASTLLRMLGTYSRKNRLYQAFQELGRVVRTAFLLRYLNDAELRRVIQDYTLDLRPGMEPTLAIASV